MKAYLGPAVFFLSIAILLPALDAQDAKDGKGSMDDPGKTTEPKKADPKKKIVRVEEAVVLGSQVVRMKIRDVLADENTKEILVSGMNPQKLQEYIEFEAKLRDQLPRIINLDENQKKEYYKKETENRFDLVFDGENKSLIVTPEMRVRTTDPPKLYDAAGNLRKVSASELAKLRGQTRLPGYTGDFGALRKGQVVDLYVPKTSPGSVKAPPPKKKDIIGEDPTLTDRAAPKMKAYMILVVKD